MAANKYMLEIDPTVLWLFQKSTKQEKMNMFTSESRVLGIRECGNQISGSHCTGETLAW